MSLSKVYVLKTVGTRIGGVMKVLKPSEEPQQVPTSDVKDLVKQGLVSKTDPSKVAAKKAKPKANGAGDGKGPSSGDGEGEGLGDGDGDNPASNTGGDDPTNDSKDQANV